ncbi:MAG: phage tail sheath subtilisin-like domain-containing protein [bacterium]|nr:phage tail sheath subtilisin-like domain-containing protein [bacterium]
MSKFFVEGEKKVRPGGYKRYTTDDTGAVVGAIDGVCACVFTADWGSGNVVAINKGDYRNQLKKAYGKAPKILTAMMEAGLTTLYCVRANVGEGDTGATLNLTGTTAKDAEADEVTLCEKYPGKLDMSVTVRSSVSNPNKKELLVFCGSEVLETISFDAATDEIDECDSLAEAIDENSSYIIMSNYSSSTNRIHMFTNVSNSKFDEGEVTASSTEKYSAAIDKLAPYDINGIAIDSVETTYTALIRAFLDNTFESGKKTMTVLGVKRGTGGMKLEDVFTYAKSINSPFVVVQGDTYLDETGKEVDASIAAAKTLAGFCSMSTNQSITHNVVSGAAGLPRDYTDYEYEQAINAGVLMLSKSPDGSVWYDSGINTLTKLGREQDAGWKKIRRTRTRLELWDRMDRTLDPLVGQITNDEIGIANVIQLGQRVIEAMVSERKLRDGEFTLNEDKGYAADYAYFDIATQDLDSLEYIYQTYHFSY